MDVVKTNEMPEMTMDEIMKMMEENENLVVEVWFPGRETADA